MYQNGVNIIITTNDNAIIIVPIMIGACIRLNNGKRLRSVDLNVPVNKMSAPIRKIAGDR